jgi:hypothetical protein
MRRHAILRLALVLLGVGVVSYAAFTSGSCPRTFRKGGRPLKS